MDDEQFYGKDLWDDVNETISKICDQHKFNLTMEDRIGILASVKIIDMIGMDYKKSIEDSILIIGMQKKYPDVPIVYSFIFVN